MKKNTKLLLCLVTVGLLALTGLYYILLAPREPAYDPGENRELAGAPQWSFRAFMDGSFSQDLEDWLLDRFFGRDASMDISMGIKDSLSIASYEDALAIMGREDDVLTESGPSQEELEDMMHDLLNRPQDTTAPETDPPVPTETAPPETTAPLETLPPTEPVPTYPHKPTPNLEDWPTRPSIKCSISGKVTKHRTYDLTNVLAVTSVLARVADLLPPEGQLIYTMVPQASIGNSYFGARGMEYFTSECEPIVQAFSPDNVTAVSSADILDEYMKNKKYVYFLSDMHWTPQGTYAVYREMVAAAGQEPTGWEDFLLEKEYPFLGTYYRDNPADYMKNSPDTLTLVTPNFPLEMRRITGKDTYKVIPLLNKNANSSDRYTVYLGGPAGPWTYIQSENGKQENCLVITDSFGLAFVPMVATNYAQTHYYDPRYYDYEKVGYTVAEMIEKYNITDVYVVVGDLHSYNSSFLTTQLSDQLGDQ